MNKKAEKLLSFTIENDWLMTEHGWGNGCVAIPPEHPLHGKNYRDKVEVKNPDKIKFNGNYIGLLGRALEDEENENVISLDLLIDIHGGITFAEKCSYLKDPPKRIPKNYWVFGFDTAHAGDHMFNWTKENVQKETKKFKRILENIDKILK
jgi:hypothetical protein